MSASTIFFSSIALPISSSCSSDLINKMVLSDEEQKIKDHLFPDYVVAIDSLKNVEAKETALEIWPWKPNKPLLEVEQKTLNASLEQKLKTVKTKEDVLEIILLLRRGACLSFQGQENCCEFLKNRCHIDNHLLSYLHLFLDIFQKRQKIKLGLDQCERELLNNNYNQASALARELFSFDNILYFSSPKDREKVLVKLIKIETKQDVLNLIYCLFEKGYVFTEDPDLLVHKYSIPPKFSTLIYLFLMTLYVQRVFDLSMLEKQNEFLPVHEVVYQAKEEIEKEPMKVKQMISELFQNFIPFFISEELQNQLNQKLEKELECVEIEDDIYIIAILLLFGAKPICISKKDKIKSLPDRMRLLLDCFFICAEENFFLRAQQVFHEYKQAIEDQNFSKAEALAQRLICMGSFYPQETSDLNEVLSMELEAILNENDVWTVVKLLIQGAKVENFNAEKMQAIPNPYRLLVCFLLEVVQKQSLRSQKTTLMQKIMFELSRPDCGSKDRKYYLPLKLRHKSYRLDPLPEETL